MFDHVEFGVTSMRRSPANHLLSETCGAVRAHTLGARRPHAEP